MENANDKDATHTDTTTTTTTTASNNGDNGVDANTYSDAIHSRIGDISDVDSDTSSSSDSSSSSSSSSGCSSTSDDSDDDDNNNKNENDLQSGGVPVPMPMPATINEIHADKIRTKLEESFGESCDHRRHNDDGDSGDERVKAIGLHLGYHYPNANANAGQEYPYYVNENGPLREGIGDGTDIDMNLNFTGLEYANGDDKSNGDGDNIENNNGNTNAMVSTEQERKILILMLLAQVCALHDSTPKTFIVHVLSLYERGILDYESIGFLFDLGLVPSPSSPSQSPPSSPPTATSGKDGNGIGNGGGSYVNINMEGGDKDARATTSSVVQEAPFSSSLKNAAAGTGAIIPYKKGVTTPSSQSQIIQQISKISIKQSTQQIHRRGQREHLNGHGHGHGVDSGSNETCMMGPDTKAQSRAKEVSAIRQHLEQYEEQERSNHSRSNPSAATTINNNGDSINVGDDDDGGGILVDPRQQPSRNLHNPISSNPHPPYRRTASTTSSSTTTTTQSSWSVENHPLSLSRYNRDFVQKKLLASGSFGQVFHAMNKLDNCDYAIKRVAFSARGYDTQQVEMVIREVQCLAKLGHENVVRYYQSWLEPSWMTGSATLQLVEGEDDDDDGCAYDDDDDDEIGIKEKGGRHHARSMGREVTCPDEVASKTVQNRLLKDIERLVLKDEDESDDNIIQSIEHQLQIEQKRDFCNAGLSAWSFEDSCRREESCRVDKNDGWDQLALHQSEGDLFDSNSISTGGYGGQESEYSEWTVDQTTRTRSRQYTYSKYNTSSKYSSSRCDKKSAKGMNSSSRRQGGIRKGKEYRYQICLFIQMQLCRPSTLADWIRNRNNAKLPSSLSLSKKHEYYMTAWTIFQQIAKGLAHVHSKGIVHRDLKPANIFHSVEDDCFKIGDFGLSKMLRTANGGLDFMSESFSVRNDMVIPLDGKEGDALDWQNPLTMGVGTSSYAAPEQMNSEKYGNEADVFSLGLILLELFSNFGSEHERAATFRDCRNGRLPRYLCSSSMLQDVGDLILSCTKKQPEGRPLASFLAQIDIFSNSKVTEIQESFIRKLEAELQLKESELEDARIALREKEKIIESQEQELKKIKDCLEKKSSDKISIISDIDK